jgi:hypothetical protein
MSLDGKTRELEGGSLGHAETVSTPKTKNVYYRMEWAGAFGDVGTLIPFVVAYITIVKMPPAGFFSCSALL